MSWNPGTSVTSPNSTTDASPGAAAGFTARILSPSTTTTAGATTRPFTTSTIRAARITVVCAHTGTIIVNASATTNISLVMRNSV